MTQAAIRREWAQALIRRASKPLPSYGSAEWVALPEGSAEKVASVVIAAECWAREADELEQNLRAEVAELQRAHKVSEDADYVASIEQHREQWKHLPNQRVPESWLHQRIPPRDLYDIGREHMETVRGWGPSE